MTEVEGIRFYSISETAKALRVTPQTVRAYIKQNRLRGLRAGGPILITEKDIIEFLKAEK